MRRMGAFAVAAVLLGAVLIRPAIGTAVSTAAGTSGAANGTALIDVSGVSDLRAAFNKDKGKVRLILLVSPT